MNFTRKCLEHIKMRGNGFLFHFTSVENLPLICGLGGIYSKAALEGLGRWPIPCPGGDNLSHNLDWNNMIWRYVSLHFTPHTPMSYRKKRDRHLCMLVINPLVACNENVIFTESNSAKRGCNKASGEAGLKLVQWDAIKASPGFDIGWEEWKNYVQAEALIPGKIPLSMVEKVAFVSEASRNEALRLLGERTHSDMSFCEKFVIDESLFGDEVSSDHLIKMVDENDALTRRVLVEFPFPLRVGFKGSLETLPPKFFRDDIDSVTLVVEMQMGSLKLMKELADELKKNDGRKRARTIEFRTVWVHHEDGHVLERSLDVEINDKIFEPSVIEFNVPIEEIPNGLGSVSFYVRGPKVGEKGTVFYAQSAEVREKKTWVRWVTLSYEIAKRTQNALRPERQLRFHGALLLSAIGDALGWPTEFLTPNHKSKLTFALPVQNFVSWEKIAGGKWWGYRDRIGEGEYSDDTQLGLAVARSISGEGDFMPQHFAHAELPLWLQYERGGGRAIKAAARCLHQEQPAWHENFYKQGQMSYQTAGANGAAMRNLPIALASHIDEKKLIRDSLYNGIITHGHPRGILGTVLAAIATARVLNDDVSSPDQFINSLCSSIACAYEEFEVNELLVSWRQTWDNLREVGENDFLAQLRDAKNEVCGFLDKIPEFLDKDPREYYEAIGALNRDTKGSGTGTVCAAIYFFLKRSDQPIECLLDAVNLLGSDTDTIASILGGMLGARHGIDIVPSEWLEKIQDKNYLISTADRLCSIAAGECNEDLIFLGKDEARAKILEWEDQYFSKMFSGEIGVGDAIEHPTLGSGTIVDVTERDVPQNGYFAKMIRVEFECGQSCVFHSRVGPDGKLSASLKEKPKGSKR